jgi:hypothetical protein
MKGMGLPLIFLKIQKQPVWKLVINSTLKTHTAIYRTSRKSI